MAGNGDRITGTENLMESSWADGTIDTTNGKKKQSSKLTYQERLVQELNMNLAGFYYNLVPGDASLEWMVRMGDRSNPLAITNKDMLSGMDRVHQIFRGYFLSELELSREGRNIVNDKKGTKDRKSSDMRFFKGILQDIEATSEKERNKLHDDIIKSEGELEKEIGRAHV